MVSSFMGDLLLDEVKVGEAFQRASFFLEKGRQLVEASESEGKTGEVEEGERPQKRGEGGGKTER